MPRRLANFIDSFVEYGEIYNAPDRYLRWAGLYMAATLVTRSVGVPIRGGILCPNLFIHMIGGPSVGKSQTIKAVHAVLADAADFTFVPSSLTRAAMQDFMQDTFKYRRTPTNQIVKSNEFIGITTELQGILPDQDIGHLTMYNDLFDLPKVYTALTRGLGENRLEYPYCSLFTGAQPQFLSLTMPEGAWGMGFMSRSIMIFATARPRQSAFVTSTVNKALEADLIHDAKQIHSLNGHIQWTAEAVELYEEWWVKHGGIPVPQAKRLQMGYNGRREINMMKMAMAISLAKTNELVVDEPDVAEAIEMLLEAEAHMPHIFNEMSASGSMIAIEDAIDVVRNNALQGRDTTEAVLIETLMQRFPSTQVAHIIENLIASKAIVSVGSLNSQGLRKFRPAKGVAQV